MRLLINSYKLSTAELFWKNAICLSEPIGDVKGAATLPQIPRSRLGSPFWHNHDSHWESRCVLQALKRDNANDHTTTSQCSFWHGIGTHNNVVLRSTFVDVLHVRENPVDSRHRRSYHHNIETDLTMLFSPWLSVLISVLKRYFCEMDWRVRWIMEQTSSASRHATTQTWRWGFDSTAIRVFFLFGFVFGATAWKSLLEKQPIGKHVCWWSLSVGLAF